ncbi:hypothetical protein [Nitrososphaera sp.]|uniref:hypothetical protein n=1 Tax=Nitrososphaera sp. TaxID=1971748 RepID=UPI00316D9679
MKPNLDAYKKLNVAFATRWHTPIIQSTDYLVEYMLPERSGKAIAAAIGLSTLFEPLLINANRRFKKKPIPYDHLIVEDPVDDYYKFTHENHGGLLVFAIVGGTEAGLFSNLESAIKEKKLFD